MDIDYLLTIFQEHHDKTMLSLNSKVYSYRWLEESVATWLVELKKHGVLHGAVVGLQSDYSPNSIALLLALIANKNIIVPMAPTKNETIDEKIKIAMVEILATIDEEDRIHWLRVESSATHIYYEQLRQIDSPGLVLFSSGTSGKPKGAVHDFARLLEKFKRRRTTMRTVNFLMFDHWGGLNTLFHTLSNGGLVLVVRERNPDHICAIIERFKVELLPASPTFLNLLIVSEAYKRYDLSSIKLITYGTEPMPESTLRKLTQIFPDVRFQQTYGLIELGVLQSKSRANDSLWVKIGGEGYQTRIVDGILQIKSYSSMLGYLNAPSPFTEDGWFITGDQVEVDGEYIKILGRKSELINVGGEKVYPTEIENIILEIEDVAEVLVYGEKNPLMGNIVCARVRPRFENVHQSDLTKRIKLHCSKKLERYKVPIRIEFVFEAQFSDRFKKKRII